MAATLSVSALRERAAAMVARVWHEAAAVLSPHDAATLRDAMHAALLQRDEAIDDDHDPRCLMPGRVVRILIADAECRDADVLAAAAFVDSVDPQLVGPREVLASRARRLCGTVPVPDVCRAPDDGDDDTVHDDDLLERLVTAEREAALIAVAERLDQARHLHLRDLPWAPFHGQIRDVYIPVAHRVAPKLAQRMQRWADAFERRRLQRGRGEHRTCEGTGRIAL